MPGFMTHSIFGEKTAEKIASEELRSILAEHPQAYLLGSQGPDIFFYNPFSHLQHSYRNTGVYMHTHNTNRFFYNCLEEILRQKEVRTQRLMLAYLSGFIGHHYLDRTAHPYIYWYTYQLSKKQHKNSFRIHSGIETNIGGAYTVKYKHQKPCNIARQNLIHLSSHDLNVISTLLSHSLKQTCQPEAEAPALCFRPSCIALTIKSMEVGQIVLRDRSGRKKKIIQTVEKKLLPDGLLTGMVINNYPEDFGDYMNLSHSRWENPWDTSIISSASFPELFHQAAVKCSGILNQLTPELLWQSDQAQAHIRLVTDKIGDYSYHSGLLNT